MHERMNHLDERHRCPRESSLSRDILYGSDKIDLARAGWTSEVRYRPNDRTPSGDSPFDPGLSRKRKDSGTIFDLIYHPIGLSACSKQGYALRP